MEGTKVCLESELNQMSVSEPATTSDSGQSCPSLATELGMDGKVGMENNIGEYGSVLEFKDDHGHCELGDIKVEDEQDGLEGEQKVRLLLSLRAHSDYICASFQLDSDIIANVGMTPSDIPPLPVPSSITEKSERGLAIEVDSGLVANSYNSSPVNIETEELSEERSDVVHQFSLVSVEE